MAESSGELKAPLDIEQIRALIPHRYPFLLVDRVLEMGETTVVAIKNVTANEAFFQGHFPAQMVMPGVLLIEAMAQAGCVWLLAKPEHRGKIAYLMVVNEAKFRRPVVPGDQVRIECQVTNMRSRMGTLSARCLVDGQVACQAEITFAFSPKEREKA